MRALSLLSVLWIVGCSTGVLDAPSEDRDGPGAPSVNEPSAPGSGGGDPATPAGPSVVRVHYPAGMRGLTLAVDGAAPQPLKATGADTWELSLAESKGNRVVSPMLEGTKARGPGYTVKPGTTLDIYPHFFETKGTRKVLWEYFKSKEHPFPDPDGRPIHAYLPPSYGENPIARYPVVYMMDGQIVLGNALVGAFMGDMLVDEAMDEGAETGTIAEAIVIAIDCPINAPPKVQAERLRELTPTSAPDPTGEAAAGSGLGPQFIAMIVKELKPLVDKTLRTKPDRNATFIAGASAGGLMASWAGARHGDVFGGIIAMSPAVWWDKRTLVGIVRQAKKQTSKVYIDIGDAESGDGDPGMIPGYEALKKVYLDIGYVIGQDMMVHVAPGAVHDGNAWAKRVPSAFAFALGTGR